MSATLVVLAAAAEGARAQGGLPQLEPSHFLPQLFWLGVCFAALYLLLSRLALPRVSEVIDERRDRIRRDLDEAERLKAETEAALAAYEQELAAARTRASALAREKREALARQVDSERAAVDAKVGEKVAAADRRIAEMKAKALAQVNDIASDTAREIVAKLLGSEATGDESPRQVRAAAGE
jgi:F-type H+-transporting ATPase subunit b